ncbi:hypothetical protein Tsubulata_040538 [Turnera subulata]|uniref:Uncharacterized protein n=1 Tax=Turnera subulata TaxID=218843 RepID=A0A9Q0G076_9ROSI|nr:hypothetical protein Tsubulata_040538 [Turnera subulata]
MVVSAPTTAYTGASFEGFDGSGWICLRSVRVLTGSSRLWFGPPTRTATMSEFLMGSGFDRLLDQLTQIGLNALTRPGNPPASKAVVESMPALKISETYVDAEAHCALGWSLLVLASMVYGLDALVVWSARRSSDDRWRSRVGEEVQSAVVLWCWKEVDVVVLGFDNPRVGRDGSSTFPTACHHPIGYRSAKDFYVVPAGEEASYEDSPPAREFLLFERVF